MNQRLSFFAPLLITFAASAALAQTTSGDLLGTVKDATGAVLPNAAVSIRNEATGVVVNTTSNSAGQYRAGNLLPGTYDIAVSPAGFQVTKLTGVLVELNKTSTADLTVAAAGANQSIEVTAEAGAVLDTTSTNLTQSFGTAELANLPTTSNGTFGVLNASLLAPGVASTGGIGIGVGPSVGGQRPRNNNFTIEGIDNNDKALTGPLVYTPNDAVQDFTLITNQFSPEFGHSSGGQFNTNVISGTNTFHGKVYEYFQNRDLDAGSGVQGGKPGVRPRYDNNRYGGQLGGHILKDKLFFFGNFERNSIGINPSLISCVPTAAGRATLASLVGQYGLNANNVAQYLKFTPLPNEQGGAQVTDQTDVACGNQPSGLQTYRVNQGTTQTGGIFASGNSTDIPLGNYQTTGATPSDFDVLTTSADYTASPKDSFRLRYIYNRLTSVDTGALSVPYEQFYTTGVPTRYQLVTLSEYHTFNTNLTNEARIGFNRHFNTIGAGNATFPGLDVFPNLYFSDQGQGNFSLGPNSNAPQRTIQNLYEITDNISYVKGKHTIKIGFDGRKYISPQQFTQRARGDYEYNAITEYFHDLAPTSFGERSTGGSTYYGDQTALYGYGNDSWRVTPTFTVNYGLRYEFTSVPVGERAQALNAAASVPGLIDFHAPQPAYKNFAPRVGINYAPDEKTVIRAGFGIAYDVLFDNLGTLSFPPQLSQTNDVGTTPSPDPGTPNFLASGGLPAGVGGVATFPSIKAQQAATSAFLPDQITPYAETYTLTVQRTVSRNFTAEIGYIGTRGIHLPTQIQLNIQPRVTAANQLPTSLTGPGTVATAPNASTLGQIKALSNIVPAFKTNNFTSKITSYQPFSGSNYNAGILNLTRKTSKGLSTNFSYTYSKTLDNATAEVFATTLTPRRPQNSQNVNADYSRSALDRTHRITLEAVYDLQVYKHASSYLLRNLVGNWTVSPIYTYESPEYATVLSGVNSNLNGDAAGTIDRTIINPAGKPGTSSKVTPQYSSTLANLCTPPDTQCNANLVGYVAVDPTAYYIQAGAGTLPNAARNTLATRPINNFDLSAYKRITFRDRYNFEFGAQAFNVLNHAQYTPGTVNNINQTSTTGADLPFQTVGNAFFNQPGKVFGNNARTMQLSAKIAF